MAVSRACRTTGLRFARGLRSTRADESAGFYARAGHGKAPGQTAEPLATPGSLQLRHSAVRVTTNRSGQSTALLIPILGVTRTSPVVPLPGTPTTTSDLPISPPSRLRVIPSA